MGVACLVMLAGCEPTRAPLPAPPSIDARAVLDWIRQREAGIVSLRARFKAQSESGGEQRAADGVLLVRKPEHFRLRLMLPFGFTVFDYVSAAGRVQAVMPLEDRVIDGPAEGDFAFFSREDLGQAFLRGPLAFPGTCVPERTDSAELLIRCRDGTGDIRREVRVDAPTATICEETTYEYGRARLVLRFDDYRAVGETVLPFRITLLAPGRGVRVDITVERYEVNPTLGDELFRLLVPRTGS